MNTRPLLRLGWAAAITLTLVGVGVARVQSVSPATAMSASTPAYSAPAGFGASVAAPTPRDGQALLIADNMNKRIVITDYDGTIVWQWRNPTGLASKYAGPLGVRWVGTNKILATFGTGEVGLIDVHAKKFIWVRTKMDGEYFKSPYDAQILPDGNLAVVTRFNHGGEVAVYAKDTGRRVWHVYVKQPHTMLYLPPAQSWHTPFPSIMLGDKGTIREFVYRPGVKPRQVWSSPSRWPHDLIAVGDGTFLSQDGTYTHRFTRGGKDVWRISGYGLTRRLALDPADPGQFVMAGGSEDDVQFRRISDGSLVSRWRYLSDGTRLDWPYGLRVVPMKEVLRAR